MKSFKLAFKLFGLGYLIEAIVGFSTYFIYVMVMWIALFALMPVIFGNPSNWTFFVDQSPWIWLNYRTILILGHISRLLYIKHLSKIEAEQLHAVSTTSPNYQVLGMGRIYFDENSISSDG